jgi:hypothetical protein
MMFDKVQTSLEAFVQTNWTATPLSFDNVAFNSDGVDEFVDCTIVFGETVKRSLPAKDYRVFGLLILTAYVKPATGAARAMTLASDLSVMVVSTAVQPVPPLVAPSVQLQNPSLYKNFREQSGWVKAQISCPFYYDLEI